MASSNPGHPHLALGPCLVLSRLYSRLRHHTSWGCILVNRDGGCGCPGIRGERAMRNPLCATPHAEGFRRRRGWLCLFGPIIVPHGAFPSRVMTQAAQTTNCSGPVLQAHTTILLGASSRSTKISRSSREIYFVHCILSGAVTDSRILAVRRRP